MPGRRKSAAGEDSVQPDMTPLIDVCFQLITFFVMIMTIAKDEAAQLVNLPDARSAAVLEDDQIPDSLNINVAYLNQKPMLLSWGLELDLNQESSWAQLAKQIKGEAAIQKREQQQRGAYSKKDGLSTTIIMRVDSDTDYSVFVRIMDVCREAGFRKFQLKAKEREDARG